MEGPEAVQVSCRICSHHPCILIFISSKSWFSSLSILAQILICISSSPSFEHYDLQVQIIGSSSCTTWNSCIKSHWHATSTVKLCGVITLISFSLELQGIRSHHLTCAIHLLSRSWCISHALYNFSMQITYNSWRSWRGQRGWGHRKTKMSACMTIVKNTLIHRTWILESG